MQEPSIEQLENEIWEDDGFFPSYIVRTACEARRKPLSKLTLEEIRVLIEQGIGVKYVLPVAVQALCSDLFRQVYYYPCDLLAAVLGLCEADWRDNPGQLCLLRAAVLENLKRLYRTNIPRDKIDCFLHLGGEGQL